MVNLSNTDTTSSVISAGPLDRVSTAAVSSPNAFQVSHAVFYRTLCRHGIMAEPGTLQFRGMLQFGVLLCIWSVDLFRTPPTAPGFRARMLLLQSLLVSESSGNLPWLNLQDVTSSVYQPPHGRKELGDLCLVRCYRERLNHLWWLASCLLTNRPHVWSRRKTTQSCLHRPAEIVANFRDIGVGINSPNSFPTLLSGLRL